MGDNIDLIGLGFLFGVFIGVLDGDHAYGPQDTDQQIADGQDEIDVLVNKIDKARLTIMFS